MEYVMGTDILCVHLLTLEKTVVLRTVRTTVHSTVGAL